MRFQAVRSSSSSKSLAAERRTVALSGLGIRRIPYVARGRVLNWFIYVGDTGRPACDRLIEQLARYSLGDKERETTVTHKGQADPRLMNVSCLSEQSSVVATDAAKRSAVREYFVPGAG